MQNELNFPQLTHRLGVVVAALRFESSTRGCLLVRPHWRVDSGLDGGNRVGRRPHVAGDPPGQHRGVQPASAGEVGLSFRPAVFDILRDGFQQVFPKRMCFAVDLWEFSHVNVGPRRVGVSRRCEAGHVPHATAWSVFSQGSAGVGGTESVHASNTVASTTAADKGGAR